MKFILFFFVFKKSVLLNLQLSNVYYKVCKKRKRIIRRNVYLHYLHYLQKKIANNVLESFIVLSLRPELNNEIIQVG